MSDKLGAYDSIKGVFADLDDGGLTDDEALEQIRELVDARPTPKRLLITYLLPVNLTVNVEEGSIESAEMDMSEVWGPLPTMIAQDADTQKDLDADKDSEVIERAKAIADEGGWTYDITQI